MTLNIRRLRKIIRNLPSLFLGYNIYVDTDKLRLIDFVFGVLFPAARSVADLGGVWKVNGAYAMYAVKRHRLDRGVLVDTDMSIQVLGSQSNGLPIQLIQGDFSHRDIAAQVGAVDVAFFFDVLLHQANPSWSEVLAEYAGRTKCMVIFNQQYVQSQQTIRLTSLPFEEYCALAPRGRTEVYKHVYAHAEEIHPAYLKPWKDIHNIFQWGITDSDLRSHMKQLGYREMSYRNYGQFSDLPAFENHAFVFMKE